MGFSLGGSAGGSSSSTNSAQNSTKTDSGTASTQNTYTADQVGLQSSLMQALNSLITGGGSSPQVQAAQNASASQINSNYAASGERMTRFLASRGFGKSGATGTAALQTELGRENALAQNSASYGMQGLQLFQQGLTDALTAAFRNTGTTASTGGLSTTNTTGNSNTDSSNWGIQGGVKI